MLSSLDPTVRPAPASRLAPPVECAHCALPVPAGRRDSGGIAFCCDACAAVYRAIHASGLEGYYAVRQVAGEARRAASSGKSYGELDDPAFTAAYARDSADGLRRVELYLAGLHCAACVWLVERVPRLLPGLIEARVDLGRSTVELVHDPARVSLSEIARMLDGFGYASHPAQAGRAREQRRREDRALLARMAVAGAVAGNVMLMAFALYGGLFQGIEREHEAFLRWGSLLVTTPSVAWCAGPFFRGAWGAIRTRTPHMDLPIAIGVLAGYLWGAWNTISGSGEIYFDTVTALVFLLLVGRRVQRRQQHRAWDMVELLHSLAPASARLVEGPVTREVPLQAVERGAVVEVWPGERVPADGTVVEGCSSIDLSLLSGESRPESLAAGGRAYAGSVNLGAPLRIRVEQTGASTRIGQLLESTERAAARRAPVVQLANRLSGYFVGITLTLAALTLLVWWSAGVVLAIDHTVALLVVTCPCALGMATPLSLSVALGRAARAGILVKGGDVLERLATRSLIVFDKTGTLTQGRHELLDWEGDESVKPLFRAAEARSVHPIARAVQRALPQDPRLSVRDLEPTLGGGLTACVGGRRLAVGSVEFVASKAAVPPWAKSGAERLAARGRTPVLVAVDGRVEALAGFGDPVRPEARRCLRRLRELGYEIAVLSGDHPSVVSALARELDETFVFVRGGATPEEKLCVVEELAASRPVVMVGDGVNDAAALAAAGVGVAVHGGAEASLAAADVLSTRPGLDPVVELVIGARRSLAVVRRGLAFSLIYNVVGATLAVSGVLTPLIAAVLMPVSSLTVVTSAVRARTFQGRRGS